MRFRKWWHTMVAHDLAELSLVLVDTLRPLLHLFLKSHAPRRTHYISHEPTQPRARPEPRSYCIRFHRLVYGFPRRTLLTCTKPLVSWRRSQRGQCIQRSCDLVSRKYEAGIERKEDVETNLPLFLLRTMKRRRRTTR